jgi:long-subunit acyl-CoA synthetase (AMP-forming)
MSETTSAHIFGLANSNRLGSVGRITRLNKSKIASPDANGCGELCISSRAVFMGYLNNLEKSKECFDDDGWLRTGGISFFNF